MNNSFKRKNILVIVFEILVIVLGIVGITFATSKILNDRTTTIVKTEEYNIDYVGDKEIVIKDLEPIDDSSVDINTKDNVVRVEFSLKGVSSNKNEDLIYDVMMNEMNIDCSLLNKYTKWKLYKNGSLISDGSLDPSFDGNVLTDNMRLTNIQEDLPTYKEEYDKYILLFWISESCSDLETCQLIDQSNIINSKMSMKVYIALYGGDKKAFNRVPNYDTSCANKPILYNKMVPVTYKNGNFVVADSSNSTSDYLWYDYGSGMWANSVIVNTNKYREIGTIIDNNDVLAYYVWIPRYRYKLWNVENEVNDTYNAYDNGIDIIFENGLNSTSKTDNYKNNDYITHPAFSNNLTGIWVSKYELSKKENNYLSVSNVSSYQDDTLENYRKITASLANNYKLGDKAESKMINNLDWGATLYLSHSKYGVCKSDGCISISTNSSYITGSDKQDTTTRNVYGVYDMAGGATEYVDGNYNIGSATNEVILDNGNSWYKANSLISVRDYMLRGGIGKGLFYFGDIGMSSTKISTRSVIVNK